MRPEEMTDQGERAQVSLPFPAVLRLQLPADELEDVTNELGAGESASACGGRWERIH